MGTWPPLFLYTALLSSTALFPPQSEILSLTPFGQLSRWLERGLWGFSGLANSLLL